MAYDIFISYSRKDAEIVNRIEEELCQYGISCFIDRSEIDLGQDFAEVIGKSLFESEILLFIWSESSNQSENTANEIALAIDFQKTIVSFKIGTFTPHYKLAYRLVRFNRIDAITFNESQIIELSEKLAKQLGRTKGTKRKTPVTTTDLPSEEIDNPLFETYYQLGKQSLLQYNLDTAFAELLEPALNGYKDAQMFLARTINPKTRIWHIDEGRFSQVLDEANKGNAFAQYIMSMYYKIRKTDDSKGFLYAQKSAAQNLSFGLLELARCYDLGLGTSKNNSKYIELIFKAISMNNEFSIYELAKNSLNGWTVKKDIARGLELLENGIKINSPICLNDLGYYYWNGQSIPRDIEKAKNLITKSIELGHIEGYENLGNIYTYDPISYTPLDSAQEGFEYFMKGSEHLEVNCMSCIALCYYNGIAVKTDEKNALKWYKRAANMGDRNAYFMIGWMYYYGNGVAEDNAMAWEWNNKGYKMTSSGCAYMLGTMCLDGHGQEGKEKKDAIPYFEESAFLGGSLGELSMLKLYDIYQEGILTDKDEKKAMQWLKKAAELQNADAMFKYGMILTDIDSPHSDEFKGLRYLQQAADKDNYEAALQLGKFYRQGIGTSVNIKKSKEYLLIAAEKGEIAEAYCELGKTYSHVSSHSDWAFVQKETDETQKNKDNALAMQYFEKAAQQDYAEAYLRIYEMIWDKDDFDNKKAIEYLSKAAESGLTQAILDKGIAYQLGLGVPVGLDKAIDMYQKAYEKGNKHAPLNIAKLYMGEEGYQKNLPMARSWLKKALELGNNEAENLLESINKEIENKSITVDQKSRKSASEEYPSPLFPNKPVGDDNILKKLYTPYIITTRNMTIKDLSSIPAGSKHEHAYLSKEINETFNAWNELHKYTKLFKLKSTCRNLNETDVYPYLSYELILKLKHELAAIWLEMNIIYPDKLANASLTNDDSILDVAEAETDENLTLMLISIVESNIGLDGAILSNNELSILTREAISHTKDEPILKLADMFYTGTDYCVRSYSIAKHWYKQVPKELIPGDRLNFIQN